ncbi:MAG: lipopolysaccharide biosynthesis protein [Bradymonadaceae bacterium]
MALKDDILGGVAWKSVARITGQTLSFLFSILLARLLTPEAFGLFGMILVFTGFAEKFGNLGFGAALIQRETIEEAHRSSVFWLNLGIGILLAGVIAASSPLIAGFFGAPKLVPLTIVVAFNFILYALVIVQKSLQNRQMNFQNLAYVEFAAIFVSGAVGVTMALTGFGVWSLVGKTMTATATTAVTLWIVSDWKPKAMFDLSAVKELFSFSAHTFGFEAYNYWAGKADDLLVGRFISASALGVYTRAYSTMLMPVTQVTKIQDDPDRVRRLYLRAIAAIGLITMPLMTVLFVVADSFVIGVYGPQWVEVIPVLKILCGAGLILPIASTVGWIYKSQGRADWQFYWGLFGTTMTLIATVLGIWVGTVEAVAASYVIAKVVLVPGSYYFAGKLIGMKVREVPKALAGVAVCAGLAAGMTYLLGQSIPQQWPHWLQFATQAPFGMTCYLAFVHLFAIDAYEDVRTEALEQIDKLGSDDE